MSTLSRDVCLFYFTPVGDSLTTKNGEWLCNKCGKTKLKSGGWTNLLNHLGSCVGSNYKAEFQALATDKTRSITSFILRVNEAEQDMFRWIEWIVMQSLPLQVVDNSLTREGMKYKPITSKLLRKYILATAKLMSESIAEKLPDKIALVFDGWTVGSVHYIGISASYSSLVGGAETIKHTLLSMRPLLVDEVKGMTARDHLQHISLVMRSFGKSEDNIMCLVGDNCGVNQSLAIMLKVPLLGCGAHKFNLAVRKWISNQPEVRTVSSVLFVLTYHDKPLTTTFSSQLQNILDRVAGVMKKASTLKVNAQLRKLTTLQTVKGNDTRWTSVFDMTTRFFRIQKELSSIQDLFPLLPTLVEIDLLEKAYVHLKRFHGIHMWLQEEGISFLRVREIFDTVLDDYPELGSHLASDASIVKFPLFERAVAKIAEGRQVTNAERASVRCLLKPVVDADDDNDDALDEGDMRVHVNNDESGDHPNNSLTYAQKVELRMKRRKTNNNDVASKYVNLDVLCGTSVQCERLFSVGKNILTDTRKSTSPAVFQAILLLKVNRIEWDVYTVGRAMGRSTGTRFTVGGDGVSLGEEQVTDDPDLFYEEDLEINM